MICFFVMIPITNTKWFQCLEGANSCRMIMRISKVTWSYVYMNNVVILRRNDKLVQLREQSQTRVPGVWETCLSDLQQVGRRNPVELSPSWKTWRGHRSSLFYLLTFSWVISSHYILRVRFEGRDICSHRFKSTLHFYVSLSNWCVTKQYCCCYYYYYFC